MGREVKVEFPPQKIISLVPSQTELLADLGLEKEIAGITKFCTHPDVLFRAKPRVGGTKDVDPLKIRKLQPDLIIANKEENERGQIEALAGEFPVWISDIKNVEDALEMITSLGEITGKTEKASDLAERIRSGFEKINGIISSHNKVAYFIWRKPYISVGDDTFIHHILSRCKLDNVFGEKKRYPEISPEVLKNAAPDLIFLSSEPYPFSEKHIEEFRNYCPSSKIVLVDGEMFSWYGSRLLYAPAYLENLMRELLI